jgi:hypothetical protein
MLPTSVYVCVCLFFHNHTHTYTHTPNTLSRSNGRPRRPARSTLLTYSNTALNAIQFMDFASVPDIAIIALGGENSTVTEE